MLLRKTYFVMAFAACACMSALAVTTPTLEEKKVPDIIQRITEGYEDFVEIDIPEEYLKELVKPKLVPKKVGPNIKPGINKIEGFRIQIFGDGNNQQSLEARARARGNAVVAKFPKYRGQVYSFSSSPNWYTRIGNFKDQKEASEALAELKRAFPQYAGEMRVVKSTITLIK